MSDDALPNSEIILYQTEDGQTRVQCRFENEMVWLSLNQMADLFQRDKSVISRHIKNVFEEGELVRDAVVADSATTAADGKTYQTAVCNLDVIISVGYRVKSLRGTQFRIWAARRLREYIVKGFTMDDERLKQSGGGAYFAELQARSRRVMTMTDWIAKLDDFMRISGTRIHCGFESETVWPTLVLAAELFEIGANTANHHSNGFFAEGEQVDAATCKDYLQVRLEGTREVAKYRNLILFENHIPPTQTRQARRTRTRSGGSSGRKRLRPPGWGGLENSVHTWWTRRPKQVPVTAIAN